jgi:hypothetical protein
MVFCHLNYNIFRSIDVSVFIEEDDTVYEKSASEPVT